jgi:hypothetical protein
MGPPYFSTLNALPRYNTTTNAILTVDPSFIM